MSLELVDAALRLLAERVSVIERRQDKLLRAWTSFCLSSPTCGPTTPTSPISTGTSTPSPTPPLIRHGRRYIPKLLGWLAEKAIQYMGPTLFGFALSGWALVKHYGVEMYQWLLAFAHWLGM